MAGPEALTRREREVAALAVQGLSAQGLGRRLGIGERTAETHLANAYAKLGIRSRLELVLRAAEFGMADYFPISAKTGKGVDVLVDAIVKRLPQGPRYYEEGTVTDVPEAFWAAELVREQLLAVAREELPHSIATRCVEWEWPRVRIEILVERDSQKGIVIGKGGARLREVGTTAREGISRLLGVPVFLDLHVKVAKEWQRDPKQLRRLGF